MALLSSSHLSIYYIGKDGIVKSTEFDDIKSNYFNNILTSTNKYIIVGGQNHIYYIDYYIDYSNNLIDHNKRTYNLNKEINYIQKIHDESFLASTNEGEILHITFNNEGNINVKERNFSTGKITSLFSKNFKSILFTDDNFINSWRIQTNQDNCNIF